MKEYEIMNEISTSPVIRESLRGTLGLAFVLTIVLSASLDAEDLQMTADGFLVRNGSPHFVIGMYESTDDDTVLRDMADHGISLVRFSADIESLDRVHKHGLSAWIPLGGQLALPEKDEEKRRALGQTIEKFKDHPPSCLEKLQTRLFGTCRTVNSLGLRGNSTRN